MHIDCDFPGGNILVDAIDGDVVRLRQDRRTTSEWWFYWHFRVRGAGGRTIRFEFTDGDVFAARGPCFSRDGDRWDWLGRDCVDGTAFTFAFPPDLSDAHFCFCIPYVQRHLDAFLASRPRVQRRTLTTSEGGRAVDRLTCASTAGTYCVPILARTHACESTANYVIEGMIDFWLDAPEPDAAFLREHADLQIILFFDIDGVETGDQGKFRAPHDHNRDFIDHPLYASTRAFMQQAPTWRGRRRLFLDVHCPWIRGGLNEELQVVGARPQWESEHARFFAHLERSQRGELRFRASNYLPHGVGWNQGTGHTSTRYAHEVLGFPCAPVLEIPYAVAGGQTMTAAAARSFGHDLARAAGRYLNESV